MPYRSPVSEYRFLLDQVVPLAPLLQSDRFGHVTDDLAEAVLTAAARVCDEVLAPLNRVGDRHPARLENGVVRTAPGFAEGFRAIADAGLVSMGAPSEYGGLDLPESLGTAVNEMMSGACMALQLNPLLTQGQIAALTKHASDEIRALYLPRLISGEWSGTMNLTEPQAGSDVGALSTRAEDAGEGTYRITGQKIFITWGDSDVTANVCHLVLARLPGASAGTKGISLFLVPKFIPDADGKLGRANDLKVVSLEHKMGVHGSPTCVMAYAGATGWLVGEVNGGMAAMFTMMNAARLAVGIQGVGLAEAALQSAVGFAAERRQMGLIQDHPDVRRMLAVMKADVFAARAIAVSCAMAMDMGHAGSGDVWTARAAFLTPIAKAFCTDVGCSVTETAMQVYGGMGYIEETGVAQYYRDVRITPIYEGTNGIQAMDLIGRKLGDGGDAAFRLLDEVQAEAVAARGFDAGLAGDVWAAAETLRETTEWMLSQDMTDRAAGGVAYLRAFARVLGAQFHLRAARAAGGAGPRKALAEVYVRRLLPQYAAAIAEAKAGSGALFGLTPDDLAA
jgi:alkylation response protein AidB-like acyl-CoA dehydrogenase